MNQHREWLKARQRSPQTSQQGGLHRGGAGGHRDPHLRLLIWENFRATERLLRATISPIFFQSFPCRAW